MWKLLHYHRLLAVLALTSLLCTEVAAVGTKETEEKTVWVAGIPKLFPLGYYDTETGCYAVAIHCFAMARLTAGWEENERWLRHFFCHL